MTESEYLKARAIVFKAMNDIRKLQKDKYNLYLAPIEDLHSNMLIKFFRRPNERKK
jgi:hypothetical protein